MYTTFCLLWMQSYLFNKFLLLFLSSPFAAVLTVEPSGTCLPAELPTVPWCACTRAILVTLALDTLAVPFTTLAPPPITALAAPCELVAWWVVAVTSDCTIPPGPTWVARASPCHWIADRVDAAVAIVVALGTPDANVTFAFACVSVAIALLA